MLGSFVFFKSCCGTSIRGFLVEEHHLLPLVLLFFHFSTHFQRQLLNYRRCSGCCFSKMNQRMNYKVLKNLRVEEARKRRKEVEKEVLVVTTLYVYV